jgi:hypothetical protein
MMHGAQSEEDVAKWGEDEGRRWLRLLGIRQHRGPSQATIQRIFRGIDRSQLEAALDQWSQIHLTERVSVETKSKSGLDDRECDSESWGSGREVNSLDTLSQWMGRVIQNIAGSDVNVSNKMSDPFLKEMVLMEGERSSDTNVGRRGLQTQEISEAGLKIWGIDYEEINSTQNNAWK